MDQDAGHSDGRSRAAAELPEPAAGGARQARRGDDEFVIGDETTAAEALSGAASGPPAADAGDFEFPSEMARTRFLPFAGAGAGGGGAVALDAPPLHRSAVAPPADAEFVPRPAYKSMGVGPTMVMPPPSSHQLLRSSSASHHAGAVQSFPELSSSLPSASAAAAAPAAPASVDDIPSSPPDLRPTPFFLMPNHFDVPACDTRELVLQVQSILTDSNVAFNLKPTTCKFKCVYHCSTGHASFRVKVYNRPKCGRFIVETNRRGGSAVLASQVHKLIMMKLAESRSVVKPDGTEVVAAPGTPAPRIVNKFTPRPVPAELLGAPHRPGPDDLRPLCTLLTSEYDEVVQDGARTVAGLCTPSTVDAVVACPELVAALVAVLTHVNRSAEARAPAAIALDTLAQGKDGPAAVAAAGGVPALLAHVALPKAASPEEASTTWHLRSSCVRALANVCASKAPAVKKAVTTTDGLVATLSGLTDDGMVAPARRALEALRSQG